jgi:hypothetical protein
LRMRGLPFRAVLEDVRSFFSDYKIQDGFICKRAGVLKPSVINAAP